MTTGENSSRFEKLKMLSELIKGVRVAMMTTISEENHLRSRPMATQETPFEDDEYLWFFTRRHSEKVEEIEEERQVNIAYAAPDDNIYVSISGVATTMRDEAKVKTLWHPMHKAWFPDGPDDPELTLLRVEPQEAEYWDATSNRMVLLAGLVKALVSGETFEPGHNEQLKLKN